jgi:dihydroorotase
LPEALARVTTHPAAVLGNDAGHIAVGAVADVCIFDPELHWRVEPAALRSQGRNTPYIGYEIQGRVACTIVDGQVVYEQK